ncbi:hypothetical protein KY284_023803 [Solanum tuberosum]|nr:hypothetical protein KY284_023803 [Solanum tuberosum]
MAEKELDGTHTNIYMEESRSIGSTKTGIPESQDIQDSQKSLAFTIPFARNVQAAEARSVGESPQIYHQNRTTGEVIRDESDTGDCSHGRGGSITGNTSTFHGEIVGRAPGDFTETPVKNFPNLKQAEELQLLAKTQNQHREGKNGFKNLATLSFLIWMIKTSRIRVQVNQITGNTKADPQQAYQSNFDKQVPTANTNNARSDRPLVNFPNPHKTDMLAAPAPYTVVQTYVDRRRYNQAKCDTPINLTTPKITTKQGLLVVLYVKDEVMKDLAAACKYTLIGKFSYTMPKVELIRNNFILQTQLSGGVKIAHFNSRHVYIDLDNELDYNMVWTKQIMSIVGQVMRIKVWTPNFKPAEETPIVPIWISLPELPWHYFNKEFVAGLLSPIAKVLYLDLAFIKKTMGSQARVKKIEYYNIPDYCFYCKHQGHLENDCTIKQRDEDKNKKEMEAVRNKNNKEMDKNPQQQKGQKEGDQKEGTNQQHPQQRNQEQLQFQQEEHWQTQRKRNNNQLQAPRGHTRQEEQSIQQAGITYIPTQNTFINLDVQESSPSLEVLDKYKGNTSDSRPQKAAIKKQGQAEYNRKPATTGLDNTNQQLQVDIIATPEGVSKGERELTHARHEEVEFDHRDRLSKKKREAIKSRLQQSIGKDSTGTDTGKQLEEHDDKQVNKGNKVKVPPDDYGALNSEDEIDLDNQSMEDSDEDAEDTMQQTGQVFGSSFQDKCTDVQRVTEQQGLSPRRRKQTRHQPHQPITSMSDTSSRPMTRSKSKGY